MFVIISKGHIDTRILKCHCFPFKKKNQQKRQKTNKQTQKPHPLMLFLLLSIGVFLCFLCRNPVGNSFLKNLVLYPVTL